jgi:hypothetical protein
MKRLKSWSVITSNVDGQFQKHGFDNARIMETHGTFHYLQCSKRCTEDVWPIFSPADSRSEVFWNRLNSALQDGRSTQLPQCRNCGAVARPAVNMGDQAWISNRIESQLKHFTQDFEEVICADADTSRKRDVVVLEIGGGKNCDVVRNFCETMSMRGNENIDTSLIRINCIEDDSIEPVFEQQTISLDLPGVFEPLLQIDRAMSLTDAYSENKRELEEWLIMKKSEQQQKQHVQM